MDVFVFAPIGLAVTASEELPRLAKKGRATVTSRLTVARMVGELAVGMGRREAARATARLQSKGDEILGRSPGQETPTVPGYSARRPRADAGRADQPCGAAAGASARPADAVVTAGRPGSRAETVSAAVTTAAETVSGGAAEGLAIPGYASLSASQVVQLLSGLDAAQREAVRKHEAANRSRRTILHRIDQLDGSPGQQSQQDALPSQPSGGPAPRRAEP